MKTSQTIDQINAMYGKVPPQAIEVEEAVLGALMLERDAFYTVQGILSKECFYKPEHQIIFETIKGLSAEKKPIDLIVVTQALLDSGQLGKVGGPLLITKLTNKVAAAAHIEFHARILAQKYAARLIIRNATEIQEKAYEDADLEELVALWSHFGAQTEDIFSNSDVGTVQKRTVNEAIKEIEADCILARKGKTAGITSGFQGLDEIIGGWRPGSLIIMAARPGIGKTSIALHFAKVAALNSYWVNFFSMEMSKTDLTKIIISGESKVSRSKIRDGYLTNDDWNLIHSAVSKVEDLPIIWNDRAGMTVNQIKGIIRKNRRSGRCDLVVIDYLQLISPTDKKLIREQQVSEISRVLKEISLNEKIPVICLSQLNREADNGEPKPSHLRESGAIEQDADIILLPWRPGYDGKESTLKGPIPENEIKLFVSKNRRGRRGHVMIYANDEMSRFSENKFDAKYSNNLNDPIETTGNNRFQLGF